MEGMPGEGHVRELGIGDLDSSGVGTRIEFGVDAQPLSCGGGPDQLDDRLVAGQWPPRRFVTVDAVVIGLRRRLGRTSSLACTDGSRTSITVHMPSRVAI